MRRLLILLLVFLLVCTGSYASASSLPDSSSPDSVWIINSIRNKFLNAHADDLPVFKELNDNALKFSYGIDPEWLIAYSCNLSANSAHSTEFFIAEVKDGLMDLVNAAIERRKTFLQTHSSTQYLPVQSSVTINSGNYILFASTEYISDITDIFLKTAQNAPSNFAWFTPDVPVEDVLRYFNEVCLDSEYVDSGNPSVIQKWMIPIQYELHGDYTQKDVQVIEQFSEWLNGVYGFAGIFESPSSEQTNMNIYFCPQEEIPERMGDNFTYVDGAVTFWYMENEIYDAIICCRSDMSQYLRNSVLLEEIYNSLGPVQDTTLRPDSLIYQYYAEPQELTAMDELIIRLLYHPDILCGMDASECEKIIRSLYY